MRIARTAIALLPLAAALAQTQAPAEFEVASVRPNTLNDRIVTINVGPGGRFAARGYTLELLIQRAYGVMYFNITGGAEWTRTDRFDVLAKANVPGDLTEAQLRPMLARLLADRFKLRLHESVKEMSGFALEVAKGGPKMSPSAGLEEHPDSFRLGLSGMSGQGITMKNLARYIGGKLDLVVVDQTGLDGAFDFNAEWKTDPDQPIPDSPGYDSRLALRGTVFAGLPRQLGLKLTPKKVPVPMLVIDSAEKPSPSEN